MSHSQWGLSWEECSGQYSLGQVSLRYTAHEKDRASVQNRADKQTEIPCGDDSHRNGRCDSSQGRCLPREILHRRHHRLTPKRLKGSLGSLDVTIYDRPGWTCTSYGLPVIKRQNNELVIGFQAQREDGIADDFYSAHAEWVFLSSNNSGKSWNPIRMDELGLILVGRIEAPSVRTVGR